MGKLEASKKPARGQQEASKRPARSQQHASKTPARSQKQAGNTPARGQECPFVQDLVQEDARKRLAEASKKPGRGPKREGPHETPKPLKNSHFHEENSLFSRAFPKTDFLEKSSWGSLKPARSQQEASKKLEASQQEASKRPARSQEEASNGGDPTKHRNH